MFKKYYEKTPTQRIEILKNNKNLSETTYNLLINGQLQLSNANQLIENQITTLEIPLGIAPGFYINGEFYEVPMATEEASVIAAASLSAKTISEYGGFQAIQHQKRIVGEIVFDVFDQSYLDNIDVETWIAYAREVYPSIYERGGGITNMYVKYFHSFATLYVELDSCDAMGANMMNTILEAIANKLEEKGFNKLMAILSNYNESSLVHACFKLPLEALSKNGFEGKLIGEKIVKANTYAKLDKYRSTTHNKGIMNGVTAVALACGNDTRALEASVHSYAQLQPLTEYRIEDSFLVGEIKIPLNLGVVGGGISTNPIAKLSLEILKYPDANKLCEIVACVGLAQNFAALRALVSSGIQKGHMKLHYRAMILAAGGDESQISQILEQLEKQPIKNEATIRNIINQLKK